MYMGCNKCPFVYENIIFFPHYLYMYMGCNIIRSISSRTMVDSLLIHVYGLQLVHIQHFLFKYHSLLIHVYGLQLSYCFQSCAYICLTTYTCIWVATAIYSSK